MRRTLSASNAPASTTWCGGYRISRGLPNRSVQLVEELTDLAEALWQAFEHRSDATSFLDQVAGDREQLCDSVTAERRARVTATQLFVSLLDVAHEPIEQLFVGNYESSQSTSGMARSSSSMNSCAKSCSRPLRRAR